ncbi:MULTISPECIES: substrate-binding domain-containing protein [Gracilibacillus]|uniref:substrate-binding domain-containing protein n=1 Tax=Gracilibacillus TaxID=74385 RepID=UPI0008263A2F|nr:MULTISPECIES: substrate-binding domain-containing protein [Gracilibacillus]
MASKITVQMIADAAGYSKYVVSKTLNKQPGVKESTRNKILFVAEQLGYFNNNQEKRAVTARNDGFVLVVMPDQRYQNAKSNYWGKVFDGILSTLEQLNYGSVVISSKDHLVDKIKGDSLFGIITVGYIPTDMLLSLSNLYPVPFVMVDHEDDIIQADRIFVDNFQGMYKLTKHVQMLGHKQICFIGDNGFAPSFYDRWLGFKEALEEQGIFHSNQRNLLELDYNSNGIEQEFLHHINRWEEERNIPTALMCANDEMATKISKVVIDKGLSIPSDISVTGFDNIDYKMKNIPPLTTVQVLKEAIGQRAVSELMWRLENRFFPNERVQIACELLIRKSTAKPKK